MSTANTQQLIAIRDERIDIDRIDHYRLSFFISDKDCQITVFDIRKKRLLLFEHRFFDSDKTVIENLQYIYDDHILVAAGFWNEIQLYFRNRLFALVPMPVFDKQMVSSYVRLNEEIDDSTEFHFKLMDDLGVAIGFGYEGAIKAWFKERYPKVSLFTNHQSTAFLKAIKVPLKAKRANSLFVSINTNEVLIAGFNLNRIAIYNQFGFRDQNQLVKLLLLTIKQFSEEGQDTPITLYGVKSQIKSNLPLLKKYFKNIELGSRPDNIAIHHVFNELETQEYFEVISNL